ncbi:MAG: YceI family protein [Acidobacteriota bacterium]|nr:YceI family protein [Acidobacteriota bacterium]
MRIRTSAALFIALVTLASLASAEELLVTLDPQRTEIRFTLDATAHKVRGTAALLRGEIRLETDAGEINGEIVADARSAETGRKGRDEDMHEKVLESEIFPRIVLRPERLDGALARHGTSEATVTGRMEIHGDTHALDLPLTITIDGSHVTVTGSFVVPYVAWGMKDPSFFVFRVGKTVDVSVRAEGTIRTAGER